jgi:hypothetical protein
MRWAHPAPQPHDLVRGHGWRQASETDLEAHGIDPGLGSRRNSRGWEPPWGDSMQIQIRRSLVAALVALVVLLIAHWLDAGVVEDARIRADVTYDPRPLVDLAAIAHIVTAAGVVAIAFAGWRSRSLAVGIGYAVVGGFLVLLPPLIWSFAAFVNGAPPVVPQPVANVLWSWDTALETGVTGAVFTIAAAMFLSGLAAIGSVLLATGHRGDAAVPTVAQAPQQGPA